MEKKLRKTYSEMTEKEQGDFKKKIIKEQQNSLLLKWIAEDRTILVKTLDGEQLTGKIHGIDSYSIKLSTIEYGEMLIYKSAIRSIQLDYNKARSEKEFFEYHKNKTERQS